MIRSRSVVVILPVIAACVAVDQVTKAVAREFLPRSGMFSFAGDTFRLQYAENKGAFLSLGASLPDAARAWIFTIGTGALVLCMLAWLFRSPAMSRWNTFALSLLCGGGIGNLIDRILFDGRVIDFLNLGIGSLRTGIFNVADMAITAGVIGLIFGGSGRKTPGGAPAQGAA